MDLVLQVQKVESITVKSLDPLHSGVTCTKFNWFTQSLDLAQIQMEVTYITFIDEIIAKIFVTTFNLLQ